MTAFVINEFDHWVLPQLPYSTGRTQQRVGQAANLGALQASVPVTPRPPQLALKAAACPQKSQQGSAEWGHAGELSRNNKEHADKSFTDSPRGSTYVELKSTHPPPGSWVNSSPGSCSVPAQGFRATNSPPSCASRIVLIGVPRSALRLDFFSCSTKADYKKKPPLAARWGTTRRSPCSSPGLPAAKSTTTPRLGGSPAPSLRSSMVLALIQLQRRRILS